MKNNRRDFLKKAVYVAPVILTMTAVPAFASSGSRRGGNDRGQDGDHQGEDGDDQGENEQ